MTEIHAEPVHAVKVNGQVNGLEHVHDSVSIIDPMTGCVW